MGFARINPARLPDPENLNEGWVPILELKDETYRRYCHLSVEERRMLMSLWKALGHYQDCGLLREDRTRHSILREFARDIDRAWLQPNKGRKMDFLKALEVLESYDAYYKWATELAANKIPLDITVPYWIRKARERRYDGPGFVRLQIEVGSMSLGKIGDVRWDSAMFSLTERLLIETDGLSEESFEKEPYKFLSPYPGERLFAERIGAFPPDPLGLVAFLAPQLQEASTKISGGKNIISSHAEILMQNVDPQMIVELLGIVERGYFAHRIPQKPWRLRFKVDEELRIKLYEDLPSVIRPAWVS